MRIGRAAYRPGQMLYHKIDFIIVKERNLHTLMQELTDGQSQSIRQDNR